MTSSGALSFASRSSNLSAFAVRSSFDNPSSCLITFNCSRRKNSRWRSLTVSLTWLLILSCSRATSISFLSSGSTLCMRSSTGKVSSTSCSSLPLALVRVDAKSVSGEGSSGLKRIR